MTIQNQNFGVEIELTGITRKDAATVIGKYFGSRCDFIGTHYGTYTARDRKGRLWKTMADSSIRTTRNDNGEQVSASITFSCEVVTPILQYEDINDLQNIIKALVSAGAVANDSCGIHVHVDGANHSPKSLTRLLNFAIGRQDLFYEALNIGERETRWCHKISRQLLSQMKKKVTDKPSMASVWYSRANDNYSGPISSEHYNTTRYHGINLHAYFTKGTVEFRLFNGTTNTDEIKAYIQFCLAMSAWSINADDKMYYKSCATYTPTQKATLMMRVLTRRLGMTGAEFKTARTCLTSAFTAAEAAA